MNSLGTRERELFFVALKFHVPQKYYFNIVICSKPKSMTLISLFVQSRKWQRERDQSLCMSESRLRAAAAAVHSSSVHGSLEGVGIYQYAFGRPHQRQDQSK